MFMSAIGTPTRHHHHPPPWRLIPTPSPEPTKPPHIKNPTHPHQTPSPTHHHHIKLSQTWGGSKDPQTSITYFLSKHCKKSDWRNCEVLVGLHAGNGATLLVGIWWRENKNDLVEWKALVDTVRIKSADLKDDFYSRVLQLIELPIVGERPQTAIPSSQFSDFVVYVVTTLISPNNQRQCANFWSINVVILFLSFKQATTAPNKLIDSQHYKRLRRKILIASHSLSHFTLTTKQLNLSFYKNFKLLIR